MRNLFLINTPYHFIVSYNFMKVIKANFKESENVFLFLEDRPNTILPVYERFIKKELSNNCKTYYFDFSKRNALTFSYVKRKFKKFIIENKLDKYFDNIFYFADHIPSNILILNNHINRCNLFFVEEGIGPYNPLTMEKSDYKKRFKQIIKKILKYPNSNGKPFGQVIKPNFALVSDKKYVYPEFAKGARFLNLPKEGFLDKHKNEILDILEINSKEIQSYKGKVLFLSQPLQEAKLIDFNSENKLLTRLSTLAKKNNIDVVVKLHPSESKERELYYESLGYSVLRNYGYVPVDLIFSILKPKIVMTVISSAALNYSMREYGKTIWLEKILFKSTESKYRIIEDLDRIIKPKNFSELTSALNMSFPNVENENNNVYETETVDWNIFINRLL